MTFELVTLEMENVAMFKRDMQEDEDDCMFRFEKIIEQ